MHRHLLAIASIGSFLLVSAPGSARADEIDACANAYETAQRHHKSGELKASIIDAQTCARDICPEILKKDCQSWVTAWKAEDREKDKAAAKEPPTEPKTKPSPPPKREEPAPAPSPASANDEPSRPIPTMTFVLGGVGIAALGGATFFMLNGVGIRNDLDRKQCRPACESDDVDRARTSFLVADILGVAGAAAIGGALVIYVMRPEANASGGTKTGSLSIIPALGGASVRATF